MPQTDLDIANPVNTLFACRDLWPTAFLLADDVLFL